MIPNAETKKSSSVIRVRNARLTTLKAIYVARQNQRFQWAVERADKRLTMVTEIEQTSFE